MTTTKNETVKPAKADEPKMPVYKPGENPPGTDPPEQPEHDPATTPVPGSNPTFNQGEPTEKKAGTAAAPADDKHRAPGHAQTQHTQRQNEPKK